MLSAVGVYIMCCRRLSYLVQEFMLCAVGVYMSTSVCFYYNYFKMSTSTIQNANFSMQKMPTKNSLNAY